MASEQLVKAVIRAAPPPSPSSCNEGKLAFAVHAAFAAAGYVLISSKSIIACQLYTYVYLNPEKGNQKVTMDSYGIRGTLLVTVKREGSTVLYFLTLPVASYVMTGGTPYASYFKNLGKFVERMNKGIFYSMDGAPAAVFSSQPSGSETRVIEVSDDDDDDSPRPGHDKQSMYLSRNSGSRMGFDDPDNHNARNNGIFIPSYSG